MIQKLKKYYLIDHPIELFYPSTKREIKGYKEMPINLREEK